MVFKTTNFTAYGKDRSSTSHNILENARAESEKIIAEQMKKSENQAIANGANCSSKIDFTNEAIKSSTKGIYS